MEFQETIIPGLIEILPKVHQDHRGKLVKIFHHNTFQDYGLETDFNEEYYSISSKGVLRGLHFQNPPNDHIKCVTCLKGQLFDVVVDLRKYSPAYKEYYTTILDSETSNILYIPKGCAHGFLTLTENAIFLNKTTTVFSEESDNGIRWDSCGIPWPDINPILSNKDKNLESLDSFNTPFRFKET